MGVKLQNIIIHKKIDYQNLAGKLIAIDAPNIIMSLFNFARKNPDGSYAGLILDRTQRPISHLYGLLYRTNFYYSKKMFPIFCFDGKVSELKKIITKDQLKDFLFTQRWYEEAMRDGKRNLARQVAMSNEYMWHNIIKESKQLLGMLGIPYIESPASSESQCAYLVKQKVVHYSNSQDFDSLLFGSPYVIQNLSKSLRRKVQGRWSYNKIEPYIIDLQKNLKTLEITIFQLVDMAILIGNDYFPGIKNIGPKKALGLIKKYNSLEYINHNAKDRYDFSDLTEELIKKIRKLFLFPDVNTSHENFYWNQPNKPQVLSLLCEEHHLNKERVKNNLEKLNTNYEKCKNYFIHIKKEPHTYQLTIDDLI